MWVGIGHYAFGHGHWLEWNIRFLDEFADFLFGAGDCGAFADHHERTFGLPQQCERRVDGFACRHHGGGRVGCRPHQAVGFALAQGLRHGVIGEIDVHRAWAS